MRAGREALAKLNPRVNLGQLLLGTTPLVLSPSAASSADGDGGATTDGECRSDEGRPKKSRKRVRLVKDGETSEATLRLMGCLGGKLRDCPR